MIRVNGEEWPYERGTVADLVVRLGAPTKGVAVALDGEVVPRSAWESTAVVDGASVEVLTAAAGG
ncbi:MAG TPA: sulfur carrier protein ThiS [Acidimicrobiales bacterium]|nr:sulfur carrier protein ThiS [Acidimicrobiales bacterium]